LGFRNGADDYAPTQKNKKRHEETRHPKKKRISWRLGGATRLVVAEEG